MEGAVGGFFVLEVDEGVAVGVEMGAHFFLDGFHVGG